MLQHIPAGGIQVAMGKVLRQRLRQSKFDSPIHEALLNVIVAAGHLREHFESVCHEQGVTVAQFNVLRILRGAQPDGLPRCEVAGRMLDRAPDVTRLLDRLERTGLVSRTRSEHDARQSIARITRGGLQLLDRLEGQVRASNRRYADRLSDREAEQLSQLLERLYEEDL